MNKWAFSAVPSKNTRNLRPMIALGVGEALEAFLVWKPVPVR